MMTTKNLITGFARLTRRLWRDRRGMAAVEFGLVGPIFIVMMCGILENGLTLLTQTLLDNATRDATRRLMIGTPTSLQQFKDALCVTACSMIKESDIRVNVQSAAHFSGIAGTFQTDSSGAMVDSYGSVGPNNAALIRVSYNRPFLIPIVGLLYGTDHELLVSTVAMQAEPYQ